MPIHPKAPIVKLEIFLDAYFNRMRIELNRKYLRAAAMQSQCFDFCANLIILFIFRCANKIEICFTPNAIRITLKNRMQLILT